MWKTDNNDAEIYVKISGKWKPSKPSFIIKKLNDNQDIAKSIFTNSLVEFFIEK